ncbi:MAG TPA: CopG family transcriptional regulator [Marinobacter sp.]|uniref:CopG family transcriptional regulator n=1 Tax=marine sediment metagenome TaxID=412755 RepID=A0A0F9LIQ0_9ZZZZ|nr:CopG family transcriptional regulator [Marinobacter sp.]
MSKETKPRIVEGTFGRMQEVEDFLPSPEELVFTETPEMVKVTLMLHKETVDFFKGEAERLEAPYQMMIRNLLSEYVKRYQHA